MHWQEACLQSQDKRAFRKTENGRIVIRSWMGNGIIQLHKPFSDKYREAFDHELEGYLDWQPLTPNAKEGR